MSDDRNADFLLHFLSAANMPAKVWFPPSEPWKPCPCTIDPNDEPRNKDGVTGVFTGPGCSNSNYP